MKELYDSQSEVNMTWDWLEGVDDIIIGGGITGLYIAWWLLNHTKKSVAILEKSFSPGGLLLSQNYGSVDEEIIKVHIRAGNALKWLSKFGKFEKTDEKTLFDEEFRDRSEQLYKPENWRAVLTGIMEDLKKHPNFFIATSTPIVELDFQDIMYKVTGKMWVTTQDGLKDSQFVADIVADNDKKTLTASFVKSRVQHTFEDKLLYDIHYPIFLGEKDINIKRVVQVGSTTELLDLEDTFNDATQKLAMLN